ncbi:armadillo-type protein [Paraphysoderma sedebokerense]|nr:armadillo-type protein [Paraphysoderma sedebokerense]
MVNAVAHIDSPPQSPTKERRPLISPISAIPSAKSPEFSSISTSDLINYQEDTILPRSSSSLPELPILVSPLSRSPSHNSMASLNHSLSAKTISASYDEDDIEVNWISRERNSSADNCTIKSEPVPPLPKNAKLFAEKSKRDLLLDIDTRSDGYIDELFASILDRLHIESSQKQSIMSITPREAKIEFLQSQKTLQPSSAECRHPQDKNSASYLATRMIKDGKISQKALSSVILSLKTLPIRWVKEFVVEGGYYRLIEVLQRLYRKKLTKESHVQLYLQALECVEAFLKTSVGMAQILAVPILVFILCNSTTADKTPFVSIRTSILKILNTIVSLEPPRGKEILMTCLNQDCRINLGPYSSHFGDCPTANPTSPLSHSDSSATIITTTTQTNIEVTAANSDKSSSEKTSSLSRSFSFSRTLSLSRTLRPSSSLKRSHATKSRLELIIRDFETTALKWVRIWSGLTKKTNDVFNRLVVGTYRWQPIICTKKNGEREETAVKFLIAYMTLINTLISTSSTLDSRLQFRTTLNSFYFDKVLHKLRVISTSPTFSSQFNPSLKTLLNEYETSLTDDINSMSDSTESD